jgi:acyl-[acyl-carrier-protein]-phospholipid O-acyltransferase/long-chain-fatty-acid--[acyl-carrier-protein] ligase
MRGDAAVMLGRMLNRLLRAALRLRLAGETAALDSPGPALFVANHPHELDPVVLAAALPPDSHVILTKASAASRLRCRLIGSKRGTVLDLAPAVSVRRLARLIASGRKVIVFPQNRPTPAGELGKLYEAPAIVAARSGVPLVPLDIRYGSVGCGARWWQGVTVTVGTARRLQFAQTLPARERRRRATDRLAHALEDTAVRARPRRSIFTAFLDAMEQQGRRRPIVEDIRETEVSYGGLLKISLALGRLLQRVTREREIVGMMLPNTIAAIGTLLGLSATGRLPAMLNYSAGPEALRTAIAAAGVKTVITSRAFVEAARLERLIRALSGIEIVYLEDLRARMRWVDTLWLIGWADSLSRPSRTTWRSCSSPRDRRAGPRAWCCRMTR